MLETPPGELSVQIQLVGHESRVHIDIETDDIPAEVARLEKLSATVDERKERWVIMRAPTASASASPAFSAPTGRKTPTSGIDAQWPRVG